MPAIAFIAAGAGALIRLYGPEYMGGLGNVGAKIDAEVARTGMSIDKIGPKVHIFRIMLLDVLSDLLFKGIMAYRGETHSDSWPSCNV